MSFEIVTHGVKELQVALDDVKVKVDPVVGKVLRGAAELVKADVKIRASGYSARTVRGVRIRGSKMFIRVEQGQRKTTGFHPSYGPFQQRNFFDPALADNEPEVVEASRIAMDSLVKSVNELP